MPPDLWWYLAHAPHAVFGYFPPATLWWFLSHAPHYVFFL